MTGTRTSEQDDDPTFASLPSRLRERIDDAFDAAMNHAYPPSYLPRKRRKLAQDSVPLTGGFPANEAPAGGFIPDESPPEGVIPKGSPMRPASPAASGFLLRDYTEEQDVPGSQLPLSLVPSALQLLDLQPDDEDVLTVFRKAASGWNTSASRHHALTGTSDDPPVSRQDWRAVCASLLDTGANDLDVDMGEASNLALEDDEEVGEVASDSAEEYVESGETERYANDSDEDSDDDYQEGVRSSKGKTSKGKTSKGKTSKGKQTSGASSPDSHRLTARQKTECRAAFALFFPDTSDKELDKQRISVKDITRVANFLKEKLSAEETIEMLAAFSTALDETMGLADFERMMIAARMA